jgi:tyrosyl-tRNA synthetase
VEGGRNPRDIKVSFAQEIVARFHSRVAAENALGDFEARFRQGALPDEMPEFSLSVTGEGLPIVQAIKQAGLTASTSEAMRMIDQGGIRLDGEKISDKGLMLAGKGPFVIQVGKRKFARISLN